MHKKIIAGVMSTLICATALTPDTGVLTLYSADTAVAVENENAAPLITAIPAEEDIIETVRIGIDIYGYIYSNGLLRVHGYGPIESSTKCQFKNAELVTQILFENEDPDNGRVITKIGDFAFSGFKNLTSSSCDDITKAEAGVLVIPDTVTFIGNNSFAGCSSVKEIKLSNCLENILSSAFENCSGITELVIPDSVTKMGTNMLRGCTKLETLQLPYAAVDKYSTITEGSFDGYSSVSDLFIAHSGYGNDINLYNGYSISKITITGGEKIPNYAFSGMSTLKEIDLSKTKISQIGTCAFNYCTSLEDVKLPDSLRSIDESAFENCKSISNIKLNNGLEKIGDKVFLNCTGIHSLTIPESVTSMGVHMLNGCVNLETLELPYAATKKSCTDKDGSVDGYCSVSDLFVAHSGYENDINNFKGYAISKITITGGEKIADFAFTGMSTLKEIDLSKSKATSIGKYAFRYCTSLENVILNDKIEEVGNYGYSNTAIKTLPDNKKITSLGEYVFEGCKNLTDITIPESYQSIGGYAFKDCTGITELIIPDNVTSMGIGFFNGCTNLETLTLPYAAVAKTSAMSDGSIDGYCSVSDLFIAHSGYGNDINNFNGYALSKLTVTGGEKVPNFAFAGMSTLKEIDISKTEISHIGTSAFYYCNSLEEIKLPDSLRSIDTGAFECCTSISNINLNNGLEKIGEKVFLNCTGIHDLTIPESVTSMGVHMLNGCVNLENLQLPYAATMKSCADADGSIDGYCSVSDLFIAHSGYENDANNFKGYAISKITVTGGEKIPAFAFAGFSNLKEIDLSSTKASSVGDKAFINCSDAEHIILPETVSSVGASAFSGINSDIYIYNPECTVSETAFSDDYSCTIHGMTESVIKSLSDSKEYKFDALDDESIIGPVNLTLTVGETYKVNSNKKDLKFTSSDPEVVNVSKDGILKAEKEGKASVEVKAGKDQSSSMNIWVRNQYVTETPAVTEPVVTTAESVTTSVSETEPAAVTTTEAVTTTVLETEPTTVSETTVTSETSTEPITTTASETKITTVTSTEPVTTTASETTVTTVTSTEPVTTTALETTVTTVTSTEPVTTAASETTVSEAEPAVTETEPYGTDVTDIKDPTDLIPFNIASLEEFSEWAKKDYSIRTGKEAAEAVVIPVTAKYYKIEIKDENGNILDTYSINPKIGIGTTSDNEVVNLPQTGNNSRKNLFTAFAALLMTILGAAAMKFSGIFDRRRKKQ